MEQNPFEDPGIAQEWILSVEQEKGQIRDKYIYPILKEWLKNNCKSKKILDLGCGQGIASQFCNECRYFGADSSSELITRANELYKNNGSFIFSSAYSLPFDNNYFDCIFSINVWFHLENLLLVSKELTRILKPEGNFLIITACPDSYDIWARTYIDAEISGEKLEGKALLPHVVCSRNIFYLHSHEEITTALKRSDLTLLDTKPFAPCEESAFIQGDKGSYLFQYYAGIKE